MGGGTDGGINGDIGGDTGGRPGGLTADGPHPGGKSRTADTDLRTMRGLELDSASKPEGGY